MKVSKRADDPPLTPPERGTFASAPTLLVPLPGGVWGGLGSLLGGVFYSSARADTATNAAAEIGVPKLLPPYSELPPTFWERHGVTLVLLVVVVLLAAGAFAWLGRRRKPAVILPPEVQGRRALETLQKKSEDGVLLSHVSKILRDYFRGAFNLPREELTTTEFCNALSGHEKIGAELATAVSDFLRRCDERKFSAQSSESLNAVNRALELISLGETRRAHFSGSAGVPAANSSMQTDATRRQDAGAPRV